MPSVYMAQSLFAVSSTKKRQPAACPKEPAIYNGQKIDGGREFAGKLTVLVGESGSGKFKVHRLKKGSYGWGESTTPVSHHS